MDGAEMAPVEMAPVEEDRAATAAALLEQLARTSAVAPAPKVAPVAEAMTAPAPAAAPAAPTLEDRLKKLKSLKEAGLIDDQEYATKRAELLKDI